MAKHWSANLKVQKLDRRMTGHGDFKYRVEFPWVAFNSSNSIDPYRERIKVFYEFNRHLTEAFGYGPNVEDARTYAVVVEPPRWAFRPITHNHTYAIYVADEEGRQEIEKVISFNILSN